MPIGFPYGCKTRKMRRWMELALSRAHCICAGSWDEMMKWLVSRSVFFYSLFSLFHTIYEHFEIYTPIFNVWKENERFGFVRCPLLVRSIGAMCARGGCWSRCCRCHHSMSLGLLLTTTTNRLCFSYTTTPNILAIDSHSQFDQNKSSETTSAS